MIKKIKIPEIPEEEITPPIRELLNVISQCVEIINMQAEEIQRLKDEIARLKGGTPKPPIKPSTLEKGKKLSDGGKRKQKGFRKRRKTKDLEIHETEILKPENLPEGSKFMEYQDYIVQDIRIEIHNTLYRRCRYKLPTGGYITASLPNEVKGHYGAELKSYILYLYYHLNVSRPLIVDGLQELGVEISSTEINRILTEGKDSFHEEKEEILETGLSHSPYIVVDDTGARHRGKNGYCTHIGNEWFAYFKSTESKNRINFLEILRGRHTDYVLNADAIEYMENHGLSISLLKRLRRCELGKVFAERDELEEFYKIVGIRKEKEVRVITEALLVGSILTHGINRDIVIVSEVK